MMNFSGLPLTMQTSAQADVASAFQTWNDTINDCLMEDVSSFSFLNLGTTTDLPSLWYDRDDDGKSVVGMVDLSQIPGTPPNVISGVRVYLNEELTDVIEFDIALHTGVNWGTTSQIGTFDIWNAVAHEVGGIIGLRETDDNQHALLTMFAYAWPGDNVKRTLALGDVLGLQAVSARRV